MAADDALAGCVTISRCTKLFPSFTSPSLLSRAAQGGHADTLPGRVRLTLWTPGICIIREGPGEENRERERGLVDTSHLLRSPHPPPFHSSSPPPHQAPVVVDTSHLRRLFFGDYLSEPDANMNRAYVEIASPEAIITGEKRRQRMRSGDFTGVVADPHITALSSPHMHTTLLHSPASSLFLLAQAWRASWSTTTACPSGP